MSRGFPGRICVASAGESRHDGYRSSGPQTLILAAILRAHFGRYFLTELAGLPIVIGQAASMAEKPAFELFASVSAAVLPNVKVIGPQQRIGFCRSLRFGISASRACRAIARAG